MTVFELGEKEQGDWFPFFTSRFDTSTGEIIYDPPAEGAAEFCFRSPMPFWEERRKDRKKETRMVLNTNSKAMERLTYYPDLPYDEERKERDDSWDYSIVGMRNARWSADGPEMEYTRENKMKLLKNAAFLRYANRVLQLLLDTGIKVKEETEKNSSTGSIG